MANLIKQTDLTSWYTTLNNIRSKHSLSKITAPTIKVGDKASYNTIYALIEQIEALKSNEYLAYATYSNHSEVALGSKIVSETVSEINADFTSLKTICTNNSVTPTNTTNTTDTYGGLICKTLNTTCETTYNATTKNTTDKTTYNITSVCETTYTYNLTNTDNWDACKVVECTTKGTANYTSNITHSTTGNSTNLTCADKITLGNYTNTTTSNETNTTYSDKCKTNSTNTNNSDKVVTGNTVHTL